MFLLLSAVSLAASVGLTVQPVVSVDIAADRGAEDTVEVPTWARLWATGTDDELRWFVEARGLYTARMGTNVDSVLVVEAGESGISFPVGPAYIEAGNLIERWGKLDLLPVTDVLNGRDLRMGPLTPLTFSRIPTPMVTGELPWSWGRLEVAWVVVPGVSRTSVTGTDWSLLRQGMIEGLVTDMASWDTTSFGSSSVQSLAIAAADGLLDDDPWTQWQQNNTLAVTGMPPAFGQGTDLMGRLNVQMGVVDGALLGGWLRSRQGTLVADPMLVELIRTETFPGIEQQQLLLDSLSEPFSVLVPSGPVLGGEMSTLLGPVGLRTEALWQQQTLITQPWLAATTRPQFTAGAGMDYLRGTWLFTAETSWRHIVEPPASMLLQAQDQIQLASAIQGQLARERLTLRAGGIWDFTFREFLVQPSLSWRFGDHLEAGLSALLLHGATPAPQTLEQAMTWSGGTLGYFGDNDAINVQLSWYH